ncbi:MAG: hypothetical protein KDE34_02695, partial [Anaerolineales bacterium]|nr:hypothetical protein [Anaerolineales bacterium]
MMAWPELRQLEIGGGKVTESVAGAVLQLPAGATRYADAQLDDYGGHRRRDFPWQPGTRLYLRARFNLPPADFVGTAGFGFWNAPFGDPTTPWPALPRAAWFFYGSPPNDFPLRPVGPGRGWFAGTIDATTPRALSLAPAAPAVLLLNRWPTFRARFWPRIQRRLGISFQPLALDWGAWHEYELTWEREQTTFRVDGQPVLAGAPSPGGPLGFVCWVDNQFLQV